MNKLLKRGYLHITIDGQLMFPSPIHERAFFMRRHQSPRRVIEYSDFETFLIEVVRRMNPNALCNSLSKDRKGYLLERQWQMEFYR
jgi:hypothetical protein